MYSRDANESSRDFELPCAQKTLFAQNGDRFESQTCGTNPRISALSYVISKIQDTAESELQFIQVIIAKLMQVRDELTNTTKYPCRDPCCSNWDEDRCDAANVNFDASFDFDMGVDVADFVEESSGDLDLQYRALNDSQVSFCVPQAACRGMPQAAER